MTPADLANTIAAAREPHDLETHEQSELCEVCKAEATLAHLGFYVRSYLRPGIRAAERYLALWQRLEREHRMSEVAEGHDCSETHPDAWCYDTCQALAQAAGETTGGALND